MHFWYLLEWMQKVFSLHLHHHCPFSKLHFGYKLLSNMLLWCQNLGIICSLICIIEYIYITVGKNLFFCVSQILLHVMSTKVWQRKCNTSPMGTKRHVRRGRRKVLQWLYYTKALPFHSFILLLEKCIIVVQLRFKRRMTSLLNEYSAKFRKEITPGSSVGFYCKWPL